MRSAVGAALTLAVLVGVAWAQGAPGDLDRSFGARGKVVRDLGPGDYGGAVAIQPDGKIVTVGELDRRRAWPAMIVSRFRPSGRLDRSFAGDGRKVIDPPIDLWRLAGMTIDPNGRIVVAFDGRDGYPDPSFGVVRLRRNGRLDRTFDRNGMQTTAGALALAVAVQPDGKILVAGGTLGDFVIARYQRDGELDQSFSGDGLQMTDINGRIEDAWALAVDDRGRIVVAGRTQTERGTNERLALARYLPNGELDAAFSQDGVLTSTVANAGVDVATLADGRVVVVAPAEDFVLARFEADGELDPSFSEDGVETTDFPPGGADRAAAIALAGDRVIVAGTTYTLRRGTDFAVARYRHDGSLDRGFSRDGRASTDLRGRDTALDLALDPEGRAVVSGLTKPLDHGGSATALVRYLGDR
jgi:uncharacterized delta-60 repeat protein